MINKETAAKLGIHGCDSCYKAQEILEAALADAERAFREATGDEIGHFTANLLHLAIDRYMADPRIDGNPFVMAQVFGRALESTLADRELTEAVNNGLTREQFEAGQARFADGDEGEEGEVTPEGESAFSTQGLLPQDIFKKRGE